MLRTLLLSIFAFVGLTSGAYAAVTLDKLNACADLSQTWAMLNGHDRRLVANCGEPSTAIERALFERSAPAGRASLCFLFQAPATFVSGFDCLSLFIEDSAQLICIRPRRDVNLDEYYQGYATHTEAEGSYFRSARQCPMSNGDSGVAFPTLFPLPLLLVARHGVGFYVSIGEGLTTNSYAWHGYATLDPTVGDGVIEIVSVLIASATPSAVAPLLELEEVGGSRVGDWLVRIGDAEDIEDAANTAIQEERPGWFVDFTSLDVARPRELAPAGGVRASLRSRVERFTSWQDEMAAAVEGQGFYQVSEPELRRETGLGFADFRRQWLQNEHLPYGMRADVSIDLSPQMYILVSENAPCVRRNQPMMAVVFGMGPAERDSRNYGSLIMMLIGACGTRRDTLDAFKVVASGVTDAMIEMWRAE